MSLKEKKQLARSLFVKTQMCRKEVAGQVGCTAKTLRKWILENEWEKAKEAETITRPALLKDAFKQLKAINGHIELHLKGVPDKAASDAKAVIRKEIEALTDNPLHKYVDVGQAFTHWLQRNHPDEVISVLELFDSFIQFISSEKNL